VAVNDDEVRRIVRDTVHETLKVLAIDAEEPFEVQKDMAFVRAWRTNAEAMTRGGFLAGVSVVVVGVLGLIWAKVNGSI
jgi:hypothetical protein